MLEYEQKRIHKWHNYKTETIQETTLNSFPTLIHPNFMTMWYRTDKLHFKMMAYSFFIEQNIYENK